MVYRSLFCIGGGLLSPSCQLVVIDAVHVLESSAGSGMRQQLNFEMNPNEVPAPTSVRNTLILFGEEEDAASLMEKLSGRSMTDMEREMRISLAVSQNNDFLVVNAARVLDLANSGTRWLYPESPPYREWMPRVFNLAQVGAIIVPSKAVPRYSAMVYKLEQYAEFFAFVQLEFDPVLVFCILDLEDATAQPEVWRRGFSRDFKIQLNGNRDDFRVSYFFADGNTTGEEFAAKISAETVQKWSVGRPAARQLQMEQHLLTNFEPVANLSKRHANDINFDADVASRSLHKIFPELDEAEIGLLVEARKAIHTAELLQNLRGDVVSDSENTLSEPGTSAAREIFEVFHRDFMTKLGDVFVRRARELEDGITTAGASYADVVSSYLETFKGSTAVSVPDEGPFTDVLPMVPAVLPSSVAAPIDKMKEATREQVHLSAQVEIVVHALLMEKHFIKEFCKFGSHLGTNSRSGISRLLGILVKVHKEHLLKDMIKLHDSGISFLPHGFGILNSAYSRASLDRKNLDGLLAGKPETSSAFRFPAMIRLMTSESSLSEIVVGIMAGVVTALIL